MAIAQSLAVSKESYSRSRLQFAMLTFLLMLAISLLWILSSGNVFAEVKTFSNDKKSKISSNSSSNSGEKVSSLLNKSEDAPVLTPNLTVNFTLNSALGERETAYYKQIVNDMLAGMPRKVNQNSQIDGLQDINSQYDHVNVVAYLPADDAIDINNPLRKDIRSFRVDFEVPNDILAIRRDSKLGVNPKDTAMISPNDDYASFMMKLANNGVGAFVNDSQKFVNVQSGGSNQGVDKGNLSGDIFTQATQAVVSGESLASNSIPIKSIKSQNSNFSKSKSNSKSKFSNSNKKVKLKDGQRKVKISFFGDDVRTLSSGKKLLSAFAEKMQGRNIKRLRLVVTVTPNMSGEIEGILESRLQGLRDEMRKQGFDISTLVISQVVLLTKNQQYVEIEAVL